MNFALDRNCSRTLLKLQSCYAWRSRRARIPSTNIGPARIATTFFPTTPPRVDLAAGVAPAAR